MKHIFVISAILVLFHFSGCKSHEQVIYSEPELKRITQIDVNTSLPVKSWTAHSNTIRQNSNPPFGVSFTDAATGQKVQFDGPYKVEPYRKPDSLGASSTN